MHRLNYRKILRYSLHNVRIIVNIYDKFYVKIQKLAIAPYSFRQIFMHMFIIISEGSYLIYCFRNIVSSMKLIVITSWFFCQSAVLCSVYIFTCLHTAHFIPSFHQVVCVLIKLCQKNLFLFRRVSLVMLHLFFSLLSHILINAAPVPILADKEESQVCC